MYKRVLLKLSGEAIKGETSFGIDSKTVQSIAKQIKDTHDSGVAVKCVEIWRLSLIHI